MTCAAPSVIIDRWAQEEALENEPSGSSVDAADEDALCRLMILLADQGRRREALQLYEYTAAVLREEQGGPATYTEGPAGRLRQGLTLRERMGVYTIYASAQTDWPGWGMSTGYWSRVPLPRRVVG